MNGHSTKALGTRRGTHGRKKPPCPAIVVLLLSVVAAITTALILAATSLATSKVDNLTFPISQQPRLPIPKLKISKEDTVYTFGYEQAPVVLEKYKFIFFATAKVGCSEFLKLCRRAMGYSDWNVIDGARLPYSPFHNGLIFLTNYTIEEATEMMTNPGWTRAIFVRDPKERLLSAYLNKGINDFQDYFYKRMCKGQTEEMCWSHLGYLETFFDYVSANNMSDDIHWRPQWDRMEPKYWPYVNFVGNFRSLAQDARALLERVGMWEEYGKDGWGRYGNESIFGSKPKHSTSATKSLHLHYHTTEFENRVKAFYKMDYNNKVYSHLFVDN